MFIIAVSVVQVLPNSVEASINSAPVMTITLDPPSQEVVVSDNAPGTVSYVGAIQVDKLPVEWLVATVHPIVDAGWFIQCSPSPFVMTDVLPHRFSITVEVPPGTQSGVIGTLSVQGFIHGGGFDVGASAKATITVRPYYKVKIETPGPYTEISPGGQAQFKLNVRNTGNSVDSYEIEIANLKELVSQGWTVTLSGLVAKVPSGEYKSYPIYPQSPTNRLLWKGEPVTIIVKASSLNAMEEKSVVSDTFRFVVYQKIDTPDPVLVGSSFYLTILVAISIAFIEKTRPKVSR